MEVRKSFSKNPNRFRLKDFLLSFTTRSRTTVNVHTLEDKKKHIKQSKSVWKAFAALWGAKTK